MKFLSDQKGQVTILMALAFVVLVGIAGLAVDTGYLYWQRDGLQQNVDAAVLAGVQELPNQTNAEAVAQAYAQKNGISETLDFTGTTSTRLQANITRHIQGVILPIPVFGIHNSDVTVYAAAQAIAGSGGGGVPACFNYAIFSGSTNNALSSGGGNLTASGDIWSNYDINMSGGNYSITGSVWSMRDINMSGGNNNVTESVQINRDLNINGGNTTVTQSILSNRNIKVTGGNTTANREYYAGTYSKSGGNNTTPTQATPSALSALTMPDLSAQVLAEATAANNVFGTASNPVTKNFLGGNAAISGPTYVYGTVNIGGGNLNFTGPILATGNINLSGGNVSVSSGNQICLYSKSGNITASGGNWTLAAILYAPNGTISFSGGNYTVNGSVIGLNYSQSGGNITVNGASTITSLPPSGAARYGLVSNIISQPTA